VAFALGVSTIILALGYGARAAITKRQALMRCIAEKSRPIMGAVFILVGVALLLRWQLAWPWSSPPIVGKLLFQGEVQATATTDDDGQYAFADLGPGVYEVAINEEVNVVDIALDGVNQVTVDLLYAPVAVAPPKRLERYHLLLMEDDALTPALMRLVASWLPTQPAGSAGFSITEAQFASTVVLMGDGIPDSVVTLLQDAECETIDMRGDLLTLARLLAPAPTE